MEKDVPRDLEVEFLSKAKKVFEYNERLRRQKLNNEIEPEKFNKKLEILENHIKHLQKLQLDWINEKLEKILGGEKTIENEHSIDLMDDDIYNSLRSNLIKQKDELNSEKDRIEISDTNEYIDYLGEILQSDKINKRNNAGRFSRPNQSVARVYDKEDIPPWAKIFFGTIIGLIFLAYTYYSSIWTGFIFALATITSVILNTTVLYLVSRLFVLDGATIQRAFTCQMLNNAIRLIFSAVFLAFSNLLISMGGIFTIFVLSLVILPAIFVNFFIPIYCIHIIYGLTKWDAIKVAIVYGVCSFVLSFFLQTLLLIIGVGMSQLSNKSPVAITSLIL